MTRFLKSIFLKAMILPTVSLLLAVPAFAATVDYKLDPNHSYVLWTVDHFGFSSVNGKILAEGTVSFDSSKPQLSKVDVTLNLNTLSSDVKHLDETLPSKDFFDEAQFPTATFKSDKIVMIGKNSAQVHGILTIKGISKPVVLHAVLRKQGMQPMAKAQAIGFTATGSISRSDFGLKAYVPAVGDKVQLQITGEALVPSENKA